MSTILTAILATFATLFPITNPLGNAAIFLSITEDYTSAERCEQARLLGFHGVNGANARSFQ